MFGTFQAHSFNCYPSGKFDERLGIVAVRRNHTPLCIVLKKHGEDEEKHQEKLISDSDEYDCDRKRFRILIMESDFTEQIAAKINCRESARNDASVEAMVRSRSIQLRRRWQQMEQKHLISDTRQV